MANNRIPKGRFELICQHKGISLQELAQIADIDVSFFDLYATGELWPDEDTLQRIYEFDRNIDWLWLERGVEPEEIMAIDLKEKMGAFYEC